MTFTDDINTGTLIRGIHVSEMRQAVDAVRSAAGLISAWTSYAPLTGLVYADHLTELRDKLNEARVAMGLPEVLFEELVATGQLIKGRINRLRENVK